MKIPKKKHVHRDHIWDGYFTHCRCGASSGDVRNEKGERCLSFDEWPKENKKEGDHPNG